MTIEIAQQRYRDFVQPGKWQPSTWQNLKNEIYLGDDEFVLDVPCKFNPEQSFHDIPKKKKRVSIKSFDCFVNLGKTLNENIALV